ncbi:hypothetical protein MSP8887_02688 [Marinomonas spartinae]|uniref:DUF58 domain-containing protein n=1 Tax=Marinomonas spartinae TaxID=1792290 RepID=UPI000808D6EE|nr:DUF58 domain-containing protein [Marinomonas spartinae]SBS36716.1 hypothetical protein MSP8887_02688 [Marinomonas spartinae]
MNPLLSPDSPELAETDFALLAHYAKHLGRANKATRFTLKNGERRSNQKGHGMEMLELRQYQPSDDLRHIDWRVTARTGHAHTRVYSQENDHQRLLFLGLSQTAYFSTRHTFISTRLSQLAGIIAWRSEQQGDKLSYRFVFGNESHEQNNKQSIHQLLSHLTTATQVKNRQHEPSTACWHRSAITNKAHNRDVIILTDKQSWSEQEQLSLWQLAKHNRVHWVQVFDYHAFELPPGEYRFADANGSKTLQVTKKSTAQAKKDFFDDNARLRKKLATIGIHHQLFDINESPEKIAKYLLDQGALR